MYRLTLLRPNTWKAPEMELPAGSTPNEPLGKEHGSLVDRRKAGKFMAHSMKIGRQASYVVYGVALSAFVFLGVYLSCATPQLNRALKDPYNMSQDQNMPLLTDTQSKFLKGEASAEETLHEIQQLQATGELPMGNDTGRGPAGTSLFTKGMPKKGLPVGAEEGEEAPPIEEQSYADRLKLSGTARYKV